MSSGLTLPQNSSVSLAALAAPLAAPTGSAVVWNGTTWVAANPIQVTANLSMANYSVQNLGSGTVAAPSISFNSSPTTGIYSSATNSLDFVTNGVQRFTIDTNGKLSSDTPSYETLVTSGNDIPNKKYADTTLSISTLRPTEVISAAGALSTTQDSIIDSGNSSFTVTLATGTTDTVKEVKLLRKRSLPVTVSCVAAGGGSFNLTATEPVRILRYMSDNTWYTDIGNSATGLTSFYPTTQQGTKLVGTGNTGVSNQGYSISLSSDGNTLAVGGPQDNTAVGAAWIYIRSAGVWSQQGAKLVGTGNTGAAQQGQSVSLSADGNTLAVGGNIDNTNIGAVWIYTRSAGVWTQQGTKLVGTGNTGTSNQGASVSLSADGNTLAVGGNDDNTNIGATWVFTRSAGVWTQQGSKLVGTGNTGTSNQGISVSLSADGNTLAVGGSGDNTNVGAIWIYTRSAGVWTQQGTKLVGTGNTGTSYQGQSVSLSADGNTLAVGGSGDNTNVGAIWIYTRVAGIWTQYSTKLVGTGNTGVAQQGFSAALSSDGATLVVGGVNDNTNIGATWVFVYTSGAWVQQSTKLIGTGYTGTSYQGSGVALSDNGNTLAVGGYVDNSGIGAAWIYT